MTDYSGYSNVDFVVLGEIINFRICVGYIGDSSES